MADAQVRIGQLRWPVVVARRRQHFDPPGGVSVFEDWVEVEAVRAEIMPIAALTFYGAEQIDMPVTHRITTRFLDYLDNSHVIARTTILRDGRLRGELFRIRRIKELNGRKRFSSLDVELELVAAGPMAAPLGALVPARPPQAAPAGALTGPGDGAALTGRDGAILTAPI